MGEKKFGELSEWGGSLERGKATRPLLGSPIFFLFDPVLHLFPPLRSLVPGYMPGQNDRQTESLRNEWTNGHLSSTLSVDWPLF